MEGDVEQYVFVRLHAREGQERGVAFERHAELAHTVRFLGRVDVLLDEPRNVTRTERIA